jgi:thiosulfate reductase/polysulfide reductase chain A
VVLSETIHPDSMFSYFGVGAGTFGKLKKFLGNAPEMGFNPNHLSTLAFNPLTGGQPAQDFIISMRKV